MLVTASGYAVTAFRCHVRVRNLFEVIIEGLHDAVRAYARTMRQHLLVSFLYSAVWRKQQQQKHQQQQQKRLNFRFTS